MERERNIGIFRGLVKGFRLTLAGMEALAIVYGSTPVRAQELNQSQQPVITMETACHPFIYESEEHHLMTAFIEARNIPLDPGHPHRIFLIYLSEEGGRDMYVANLSGQISYSEYIEGHVKYHPDSPLQEDTMYEASLRVQADSDDPIIVAVEHRSARCSDESALDT